MRRLRRWLAWIVVGAGLAGLGPTLPAVAQKTKGAKEAPPSTGRPAQDEIAKLQTYLGRAKNSPARQVQIVQQAAALGPEAVAAVQETIEEQMRPELDRYRRDFYVRAAGLSKQHFSQSDPDEIAQLRKQVLGLQHQADFSKELIVAKGDPAMQRLEAIYAISPMAVLARSMELQRDRKRLMMLGVPWQQCALTLYNQLPNDANKPEIPPSFERYLLGEEQLAVRLCVPMDQKDRETLAANAKTAAQLNPEEARTILALNLTRVLLGLPALGIDLKLSVAARDHSRDMHKRKFFAHESPVPGKKTPWDRAKRFGTTASGENIAVGYQDGIAANLGWFHSPGHHKNMLGAHTRVGVGRVGSYYTEMFGN